MSDHHFYQGSFVGKFFGQMGALGQIGGVITLFTGDFATGGLLFLGGLASMYLGYLFSGGPRNPYLY